jgi:hypothetical protein
MKYYSRDFRLRVNLLNVPITQERRSMTLNKLNQYVTNDALRHGLPSFPPQL